MRSERVLGADGAEAFLSEILTHDYSGDGGFRIGRIVYTDGMQPKKAGCECSEPQEVFDPRTDKIVITSEWTLAGTESASANNVSIKVRHRVVATTEGEGAFWNEEERRKIAPEAAPRNEFVIYKLRRQEDGWKLIDPPLPRVGVRSLMSQYRSAIADREEAFARLISSGANLSAPGAILKWEKEQLNILENCCAR